MYIKQTNGTTRAIDGPILNKQAVMGGIIDPPTIDIINKDEASFELSPRFLHESAKMVGNMMDWKK